MKEDGIYLDGSVTGRRYNEHVIKVDDIDCRPVANEHTPEIYIRRRLHVPDGYRTILKETDRLRYQSWWENDQQYLVIQQQ